MYNNYDYFIISMLSQREIKTKQSKAVSLNDEIERNLSAVGAVNGQLAQFYDFHISNCHTCLELVNY